MHKIIEFSIKFIKRKGIWAEDPGTPFYHVNGVAVRGNENDIWNKVLTDALRWEAVEAAAIRI